MRIREATAGDAAWAAVLWTEAYSGAGPGEGRTAPYGDRDLASCASTATVLVAESPRGLPIGIVALRPAESEGGAVATGSGEAELSRLAVAAAARRQGAGRALAQRCVELAREQGAEAVVLWSRPYQLAAHSLYERLGFRRVPARDGHDPDGRRWVFRLAL